MISRQQHTTDLYQRQIEEEDEAYKDLERYQNWGKILKTIPNKCPFKNELQIKTYKIIEEFYVRRCKLTKFISYGGQGIVFEGKECSNNNNDRTIFKILLKQHNDEIFQNEIFIMQLLSNSEHFIKYIKHFMIDDTTQVIVLEKYKSNLRGYLNDLMSEEFTVEMLLKMIFDLLDGLIILRQYKILHLDIKPENILVSKTNTLLYTDFGISERLQGNLKTSKARSYTESYAPEEQIMKGEVDYRADIFSLGKTFVDIIDSYKKIHLIMYENDLINSLEEIITNGMENDILNLRLKVINLHKRFWKIGKQNKTFQSLYFDSIKRINDSQIPYDNLKDSPYSIKIQLYYSEILLQLQINQRKPENEKQIAITKEKVARNYFALGNLSQALNYYKEIIKDYQYWDFQEFHQIQRRMADVYFTQGDLENAYQQSNLQIQQSYFLLSNEGQAFSLEQLGIIFLVFEQFNRSKEFLESSQNTQKQSNLCLASIYNHFGLYHGSQQNWQSQKGYFALSRDILKTQENLQVAICYQNMANNHSALGNYQKSLSLSECSLRIKQKFLNKNNPQITSSVQNLGIMQNQMGNTNLAISLFNSLKEKEEIIKENSIKRAIYLNNLGVLYSTLGDFKNSESLTLEAYNIQDQLTNRFSNINCNGKYWQDNNNNIPIFSSNLATIQNNLGLIYCFIGDFKKGFKHLKESEQIKRKINKENFELASSFFNQGFMNFTLSDFERAENQFNNCLTMRKIQFQNDNTVPVLISSHNSLGCLFTKIGKFTEALYHLQKLTTNTKFGQKPDVARTFNNFGNYNYLNNNLTQALSDYKKSLLHYEEIYKNDHQHIATVLNNIGVLYLEKQDYQNAFYYLTKSHKIFQETLNSNNTREGAEQKNADLATTLNNLGYLYISTGNIKRGQQLLLQSLEMRKQLFGYQLHSDRITSLQNIAFMYYILNDFELALQYSKETIRINKRQDGDFRLIYVQSINLIAQIYYKKGQHLEKDRQEPFYKLALKNQLQTENILNNIFKQNTAYLALILSNIAQIYSSLGQFESAITYQKKSVNMFKELQQEGSYQTQYSPINFGRSQEESDCIQQKKAEIIDLSSNDENLLTISFAKCQTADSLYKLGIIYESQGDLDSAQECYFESINTFSNLLSQNIPTILLCLNKIKNIKLNHFSEAWSLQDDIIIKKDLKAEILKNHFFLSFHLKQC